MNCRVVGIYHDCIYWITNNAYHRKNGPAVIYPCGSKSWWKNGKRHRIDVPAVIYSDGTKEWFKNGKEIK